MIAKSSVAVCGVALAGAAVWLGYHAYAPASQLYGTTISHFRDPHHLGLTFDDGPNDLYTERLLEILARHEVRATFFLVGKFVQARPHIARAVVAAGHQIGNHTASHPNLALLSSGDIRAQLVDASHAIADVTGVMPELFRPPFGARRPGVLRIARELGMIPVMWDITCYDWRRTSPEKIENRARRVIEGDRSRGHIVLLHDGGHTGLGADRSATLAATERLLARYRGSHQFRAVEKAAFAV